MVPEFGLTVIDATLPIETQQQQMRELVISKLTRRGSCGWLHERDQRSAAAGDGTLDDLVGKIAAAMIGNAAFFAPGGAMLPSRRRPPSTINLVRRPSSESINLFC